MESVPSPESVSKALLKRVFFLYGAAMLILALLHFAPFSWSLHLLWPFLSTLPEDWFYASFLLLNALFTDLLPIFFLRALFRPVRDLFVPDRTYSTSFLSVVALFCSGRFAALLGGILTTWLESVYYSLSGAAKRPTVKSAFERGAFTKWRMLPSLSSLCRFAAEEAQINFYLSDEPAIS